jgi:hypothetical protein
MWLRTVFLYRRKGGGSCAALRSVAGAHPLGTTQHGARLVSNTYFYEIPKLSGQH